MGCEGVFAVWWRAGVLQQTVGGRPAQQLRLEPQIFRDHIHHWIHPGSSTTRSGVSRHLLFVWISVEVKFPFDFQFDDGTDQEGPPKRVVLGLFGWVLTARLIIVGVYH